MLGANMLMTEPLRFFRGIRQNALALVAQRKVDGRGHLLPNGCVSFNLFPDRLDRRMRAQKAVGQGFVPAQQTQQQVLGLDVRRAELAGLIPRKKDHAPRFFRVPLEHVALTWDAPQLTSADEASLSSPRYEPPHIREEALLSGCASVLTPASGRTNQQRLPQQTKTK